MVINFLFRGLFVFFGKFTIIYHFGAVMVTVNLTIVDQRSPEKELYNKADLSYY